MVMNFETCHGGEFPRWVLLVPRAAGDGTELCPYLRMSASLSFSIYLEHMQLFLFIRHSGATTSTIHQATSAPDNPIEFVMV